MGFVFPGIHLGKRCFFAFFLAEAPSQQVWGSCRGHLLLLPKEPRDRTYPFHTAKACQFLPSFRGTLKHTLFYILPTPGPPRPKMAPFSLSAPAPNTCLTRPSLSLWMCLQPAHPPTYLLRPGLEVFLLPGAQRCLQGRESSWKGLLPA